MNPEIDIKQELNRIFNSYQSEMRALPIPLRELAPISRRGLSEDNVMLCLPFWLLEIFDFPEQLSVARALALANYYGTAYCLLQDRVIDGDHGADKNSLIITNIYFSRWLAPYRKLFGAKSSFWTLFDTYLEEYCNSIYWETKHHWGQKKPFPESDLIHLGHKFSPTKICCAGLCLAAGKEQYIGKLSLVVDHFHIGYQLRDDYLDWKIDLKRRHFTYFLQNLMEPLVDAGEQRFPTEEEIEEVLLHENPAESLLEKSTDFLLRAKKASAELGCTKFCDYMDRVVQKNETEQQNLSRRKALQIRASNLGPHEATALFPHEMHTFEVQDESYVFLVRSLRIFTVDSLSLEVLRAAEGTTVSGVFLELADRFPEDDIRDVLQELVGSGVIGLEEEEAVSLARPEGRPLKQISLNITHSCNLRCAYCYGDEGGYGSRGSAMSPEVARSAIDLLIKNSSEGDRCTVIFFGGEPLLCMDLIKDAVAYGRKIAAAHDRQLSFSLTTNGALLTDEAVSLLEDLNVGAQISIDGPTEVQNRNRPFRDGNGSYEAVVSGAARLIEARPNAVGARCTVASGETDLKSIVSHLASLGFNDVHIEPAEGDCTPYVFGAEDYERLKGQYDQIADHFLGSLKNGQQYGFSNFTAPMAKIHRGTMSEYLCGAGRSLVAVSPDGGLYPCHRFVGDETQLLGNVRDWDPGVREEFYSCTVDVMNPCSTCWARYFCTGGCIWSGNFRNKSIKQMDERRCGLIRHSLELSLKIYCRLSAEDRQSLEKNLCRGKVEKTEQ